MNTVNQVGYDTKRLNWPLKAVTFGKASPVSTPGTATTGADTFQIRFGQGLRLVKPKADGENLIQAYEQVLGTEEIAKLKTLVQPLAGKKVAHINATDYGGGVAELLHRQIPFMNQLGFKNDWFVLSGTPAFYDVTKKIHNMLQGKGGSLTEKEKAIYRKTMEKNLADSKLNDYDLVIIHDPQPAGLIDLHPDRKGKWVWRCHIDTTNPNKEVWDFISQFVKKHDGVIFTRDSFVPPADRNTLKSVTIIPPSIDPVSPKNAPLSYQEVKAVLTRYNIDPKRPMMLQVSRFDPWKQPLEVIQVYKELKQEHPGLQLVLAGSMASDDPEGMVYWEKVLRKAGEDDDIKVLTNLEPYNVGNKEINALQQAADVVLQYSSKEGFGLTVSEAMWKRNPVVGGKVGGIQDQIVHGETGYLVSTNEETKEAIRTLLANPDKRAEMGQKAYQRVKENFLLTAEVKRYLMLALEKLGIQP